MHRGQVMGRLDRNCAFSRFAGAARISSSRVLELFSCDKVQDAISGRNNSSARTIFPPGRPTRRIHQPNRISECRNALSESVFVRSIRSRLCWLVDNLYGNTKNTRP